MIKHPTNIEQKYSQRNGKPYSTVTWTEGRLDNINNIDWIAIVNKALHAECGVEVTYEKKGEYDNVSNMTLVEKGEEKAPAESATAWEPASLTPRTPSGQEIGLWWKLMGEAMANGLVDPESNRGKIYRMRYFAQMDSVLGIKIDVKETTPQEEPEDLPF